MPRRILSGRCFWGRCASPSSPMQYTLIRTDTKPLSVVGNAYYERRFGAGGGRRGSVSSSPDPVSLPSACVGDVLVRMGPATPLSLRERRVVDVTGIRTSFLDASERCPNARAKVEDVIASMHLHDGHEVPALQRGVVAVGRLRVWGAYAMGGEAAPVWLPLENTSGTLLRRRSLVYHAEMEGIQLVRAIAESCAEGAARGSMLRPVMRAGEVVAVRLQ